ncbi:HprK-related kinase B [candidate division WOR-3 bacterium]|nr:HprK-related kinase B [candidate division WOR-3 bacterium]
MNWTVESIKEEFNDKFQMKYSICLNFCGQKFSIKTDSQDLLTLLKKYYSNFISRQCDKATIIEIANSRELFFNLNFEKKQPDPGKNKIKEEFHDLTDGRCVRKILTGMVFVFGGNINLAIGDCLNNSNQIINYINNRFIQKMIESGSILLHSSAVSHFRKGIAISGFSGTGKSTLALQLVSRGLAFISNDRVLCKDAGDEALIYGIAKYPRINPGTIVNNPYLRQMLIKSELDYYKSMDRESLWNEERKFDVFIEDIFGKEKFKLESKLKYLLILNWSRKSPENTKIERIELKNRPDLYPSFLKPPGLFYIGNYHSDQDRSFLRTLEKSRVFEATGKPDFDFASEFFLKTISG